MTRSKAPESPFAGPGEMAALCRGFHWASTPLGPVEGWPSALRVTVRTCLDAALPIAIWCEPALTLIYNDSYRRLLGPRHPGALGRAYAEVWPELWDEVEPMFGRLRAGGPPIYAEDAPFALRRDGDAAEPNAWFTFSLSAVRDEQGEIVAFLNVASETTDRIRAEKGRSAALAEAERAEARLRDIFAHAPAFMAVLRGPAHVFEYANAAYYRLVGERELIGRPVLDALPEVRGQGFEQILDRVVATGEPFVGRETAIEVSRGRALQLEQRFVDFIYYPITETDGSRSGVVAHGYDVTDHVLTRREAERAHTEANRANEAKSHFLAHLSHEIRTPINAVMGYTDLLDAGIGGKLSAPQQEYVDRIRVGSRHLLTLVNDVLDLSKIEAGEMSVELKEGTIDRTAAAALQMVAPQAQAKRIGLSQAVLCDDVRFVGDEDRVRQIVLNLLSNAVKFTEPGGTVTVRCGSAEAADEISTAGVGPWVTLEVEDTGRGIPADQIEGIFEPFVQADDRQSRGGAGGTGLGLTISRRFARLMGGDLTVRSTLGVGSCFTLWLPRSAARRRVPPTASWPRSERRHAEPTDRSVLRTIGRVLLESTEMLESELVLRLRTDPDLPDSSGATRGQLADHVAPYLATLGKLLSDLAEGPEDHGLNADGEDIMALVAHRHGGQRRRLGWERRHLAREYQLLHDLLDSFLRREVDGQLPEGDPTEPLGIVHRLLDRAEATTLAAFEGAEGEKARAS